MDYYIIIVPQCMYITTQFSTFKLLFFSFSSCLTIDRSIVFRLWTGNANRFRGLLAARADWIKVLYLFGTLGFHRILTNTFSKLKKKKKKKLNSKISKKFKMFIRLIVTMHIYVEVYSLKRFKLLWMTGKIA